MAPLSAIRHSVVVPLSFLLSLSGSIFVIFTEMNGWLPVLIPATSLRMGRSEMSELTDQFLMGGSSFLHPNCKSL